MGKGELEYDTKAKELRERNEEGDREREGKDLSAQGIGERNWLLGGSKKRGRAFWRSRFCRRNSHGEWNEQFGLI